MRFKNGFECYDNRVGSCMMGRVAWPVAARRRKRGEVVAVRSDPTTSARRESERMLGGGDGRGRRGDGQRMSTAGQGGVGWVLVMK